MTAPYGKLGGRRRGSGAWQWIVIGFFPGLLCGGIILFALMLGGLFNNFGFAQEPTPLVETQIVAMVVTATPDAGAATNTPFIITATPGAATQEPVVLVPSPTPSLDPAAVVPTEAIDSPDDVESVAAPAIPSPTVGVAVANEPQVPEALSGLITSMVTVQGGTFQMGTTPTEVLEAVDQCIIRDGGQCNPEYGRDSSPPFQAQLDDFQIEITEVTFQQYVSFLNYLRSQGLSHRDGCSGFLCIQTVNENEISGVITFDSANYNVAPGLVNHPVYAVTWYGAQAYCEAIGRRLPTEAEWEHAARGSLGKLYPWGDEWNPLNAKVRIDGEVAATVPVGSYPAGASDYGALDMAGNVAEWVQDWYSADIYQQRANQPQPIVDPQGPPVALEKVLRGGSWDGRPFFARSVHRQSWTPAPDNIQDVYPRWVGFRCAADATNTVPAAAGVNPGTLGTNAVAPTPETSQPALPISPEELLTPSGAETDTSAPG